MGVSYLHIVLAVALVCTVVAPSIADPAGCLSPEEEQLLLLVNAHRVDNGYSEVPTSLTLTLVGQWHAMSSAYAIEEGEWGSNPDCDLLWTWYDMPDAPFIPCCYYTDFSNPECTWHKPAEITPALHCNGKFSMSKLLRDAA